MALAQLIRRFIKRGSTGGRGETLAANHLKQRGYRILMRNVRHRFGELDIIAEAPDKRTIVIVEVKASAASSQHFAPEIRVNRRKQRKLITLATIIARRYRWTDRPIRFDVIAIEKAHDAQPTLRHHESAFQSRS